MLIINYYFVQDYFNYNIMKTLKKTLKWRILIGTAVECMKYSEINKIKKYIKMKIIIYFLF